MNKLSSKEVMVIQLALTVFIEENEEVSKDSTLPFTPEARSFLLDMRTTAKSALEKINITSGHEVKMDPFTPGDENEFLTKES